MRPDPRTSSVRLRIVRGLPPKASFPFRGACFALGMFDGVHLGHRAILEETVRTARILGTLPVVLTFDPHPRGILARQAPPFLASFEHRTRLWARAGIEGVWVIPFDAAFAAMPAEQFVREVLGRIAGAKAVVLGTRARFGRRNRGGAALLARLGKSLGIEVRAVPPVRAGRLEVSSTAVRAALAHGRLRQAERLLGRPVSYLAPVVRGMGIGRRLGFPTANLDARGSLLPPAGIYAGRARPDGDPRWRPAGIYLGNRPTFGDAGRPVFEVHLAGVAHPRPLEGRLLEVEFFERLRKDRKFPSAEALVSQIRRDIAQVLRIAGARRP